MIEVGEYIRTDKGTIAKIEDIEWDIVYRIENMKPIYKHWITEKQCYTEEITKHSKSIIDLIEVGDYVNGMRVIATENRGRYNEEKQKDEKVILTENYDEWTENGVISNEDIKTILTHEIYEREAYKIE